MLNKEIIAEWYEKRGPKWCAKKMGVSYDSVKQVAHSMGLHWAASRRGRIEKHLRGNLKEDGWKRTAELIGLSEGSVRRWAKKLGIDGPPDARGATVMVLTDENASYILEKYPAESCVSIGESLGLSRDVVEGFLRRSGLYLGFGRREEVAVDKSFFEWSEDLAYVFGYMMADGSVGEYVKADIDGRKARKLPTSSITSKDRQVLDNIRERMRLASNVCSYVKDGETYHHLTTNCRWIYERWLKMGVKPRKSYEGIGVPNVPLGLVSHFVRGFFDGDGSRSEDGYSVKFGCTDVNFICWLRDVLIDVVGGKRPAISCSCNNTPFFSFVFYATRAKVIIDWMKPTKDGLRLRRKWKQAA